MSAKKAKRASSQANETEGLEKKTGDEAETTATTETAGAQSTEKAEQEAAKHEASEENALQQQVGELNDKLIRTLAEYDNYRKRSQKERMEIYPDAVAATVTKLLPVLDNFERAMETQCADVEFKKGVDMIFTSFQEFLKSVNVTEIEAAGKAFDPNLHNAVMHIEDETLSDNMVAAVFQKGYQMGDRVLRHAMVQVAN